MSSAASAEPPWAVVRSDTTATREQLEEIVRLAPIGVGIVDRHRRTILSNDALCGMLGYTPEEFARLAFEEYTHPDDVRRNDELFREMFAGLRDRFELEKRFIHRDGHVVWGRLLVSLLRDDDGEPSLAIGLLQDITEERRLREELERLAFFDPLTALPNRRLLIDRIEQQIRRRARRGGPTGALLFADIDDFKRLNDTLGHQGGDKVLEVLAARIEGCLRPGDTAGRLGGDEFAVLLEHVEDMGGAVAVAERLKGVIEEPVEIAGTVWHLTASIGVALLGDGQTADDALRCADLAMYHAKALGRGRIAAEAPER